MGAIAPQNLKRSSAAAAALLLLADGRFPAGGHAHSGGTEPAVTADSVRDLPSLRLFLLGRLRTAGVVAAALAAATCARPGDATALEAEADARTPSPAQRAASRRQGRALLRAARIAWPDAPALAGLSATSHHAVALGAAAAAAGCGPAEAALIAAYQSVTGPASAAVRLLALDPLQVNALLAGLTSEIDEVAQQATATATAGAELPCPSAPALDQLAEAHARAEVRLFAS
jgi:urease accessory protein